MSAISPISAIAVFSNVPQKVMTEGFLKPNAKTVFFKAILKICIAQCQLII